MAADVIRNIPRRAIEGIIKNIPKLAQSSKIGRTSSQKLYFCTRVRYQWLYQVSKATKPKKAGTINLKIGWGMEKTCITAKNSNARTNATNL